MTEAPRPRPFGPLGIRGRLAFAFGLQLAIVAAVAVAGLLGLGNVKSSFQSAIDHGLEVERLAGEIKAELLDARRSEMDFLLSWPRQGFRAAADKHVPVNQGHVARVRDLVAALAALETAGARPRSAALDERIIEDLVALEPYLNVYAQDFRAAVALIGAGERTPAAVEEAAIATKIEDFQSAAVVIEPLVDDIAMVGRQAAVAEVAAAEGAASRTALVVALSLAAAMLTGLWLAYLLGHQITAPLLKLAKTSEAIGRGDLTARAEVASGDEIGTLAHTFNVMAAQLRGLVHSLEGRVRERARAEDEIRALYAGLEERVRERTSELEAANRELEAFSYSVSHDLRTPLRHIAGFVYLLGQGPLGGDAETRSHLEVIAQAVKRMGQLIDALLAFSRIGRAELNETEVALGTLVEEARAELLHEAEGRPIAWNIRELPTIAGDRALLRVVVVNLLSNAIKFTRPRSTAEIEIRGAPEVARAGEEVFLVRDNGVGFDMAYADKLFGVFKRLHRAQEFEGTGIGLANVERIVRRHGGRVWAEAAPDAGATFFVALPRAQSRAQPREA